VLRKSFCIFALLVAGVALPPRQAHAQTYTESVLYNFCSVTGCADGQASDVSMMQAADGNLYGATEYGGMVDSYTCYIAGEGCGVIFKISPSGTYTVLVNSAGASSLVQGPDGNLYGTSGSGGPGGSVFRLTPDGVFTTIYTFCRTVNSNGACADGGVSVPNLILGTDGNFYGTSYGGGAYGDFQGYGGAIYKMTPSGVLTTLYSFCQTEGCPDGLYPNALVQGTDGNFYGTTVQEGGHGGGTVFKITAAGVLTTLYNFCSEGGKACTDGAQPFSGLVEGPDGNFYGTTAGGGVNDAGTFFKITPSGVLTTLSDLQTSVPIEDPTGNLILGGDDNFYSVSYNGGQATACAGACGTVFEVTSAGVTTDVYDFCNGLIRDCTDAENPTGLVQGGNGDFYGTGFFGGTNQSTHNLGVGAIFKVSPSPALPAPVQVALSQSTITLGQSVTLNWQVRNAFSLTMQQCYAFAPFSASGAGKWTGLQAGSMSGGVFSGSATIQPTANGVYAYSLTCGGVETGHAVLHVGSGNAASSTTLYSNAPALVGAPLALAVAVYPQPNVGATPTGTVTIAYGSLSSGPLELANGAARLNVDTQGLAAGSYTISVAYSGDSNYAASSTTATIVLYARYPTFTYLTANSTAPNPPPVIAGQPVTLNGTVISSGPNGSGPTGTVTFYSGSTVLGSAALSGDTATLTLPTTAIPVGVYTVTAVYSGDSSNPPSSSTPIRVAIQTATMTTLSISPTTVAKGQHVTLSAAVTRASAGATPTGSVGFFLGTSELGSAALVNGTATLSYTVPNNTAAGTYAVTATYSGDSMDAVSTSAPVSVVVDDAATAGFPPGDRHR